MVVVVGDDIIMIMSTLNLVSVSHMLKQLKSSNSHQGREKKFNSRKILFHVIVNQYFKL